MNLKGFKGQTDLSEDSGLAGVFRILGLAPIADPDESEYIYELITADYLWELSRSNTKARSKWFSIGRARARFAPAFIASIALSIP